MYLRQAVQEEEVDIGMTDVPWKTKLCIIGLLLGLGTDRAQ